MALNLADDMCVAVAGIQELHLIVIALRTLCSPTTTPPDLSSPFGNMLDQPAK